MHFSSNESLTECCVIYSLRLYSAGAILGSNSSRSGKKLLLGIPICSISYFEYTQRGFFETLSLISPSKIKLRSLYTNLVAIGQSRVQLQVHFITYYLVLGRVQGQSGSSPALCKSKLRIVVASLPWLAYSGMNLVTKSSIPTLPSSQRCIMHVRVAVTLVKEAKSKMVSFEQEGELKGSQFFEKCPKAYSQIL